MSGISVVRTPEGHNVQKTPMISIVDDDASVREGTKRLMKSLGYLAATFASAQEFLCSEQVYDTSCLISDVKIPGMSGIELQSALIAKGYCIPIIFVTAYPEEKVRKRALAAGAICFLSKPCNEERLIGCLNKALNSGAIEDGRD